MDSGTIQDYFKEIQISKGDNNENAKESMEEVPKILSPEIQGVFHIFASMLDMKSFMKLAITSKEIYKHCMEGKEVKINVDVKCLTVRNRNGFVQFDFSFANVADRHKDSYAAALQQLQCNVKLGTLEIRNGSESPEISNVSEVHRYLKEIGVYKIDELILHSDVREWETIFAIIKDFYVKGLTINSEVHEDILCSILQLNLEEFSYNCEVYNAVSVDFILDIDSPIREINFAYVDHISRDDLMDVFSNIQSDSLHRLIVNADAVDWGEFHSLPFDHEGPLPDERPLLFEKATSNMEERYFDDNWDYDDDFHPIDFREYWFLHENGDVMKCIVDNDLQIFKCEPCEYPWILRKEEDILKDLSEKRPKVSCSASHFHTFCANLNMIDRSGKGTLPEHRPIYFKASENRFWLLDENDDFRECSWENDCATWEPFNPRFMERFDHPALAKYIFWKVLKQVEGSDRFLLYCKGIEEFDSWLVNFSQLPFDYSGPLPNERPLIFKRASSKKDKKLCSVLLDDRLIQCERHSHEVVIKNCHHLNRPVILFTAKNFVEMLKDSSGVNVCPFHKNVNANIRYEEFLEGFHQFKKSSLVLEKRIVISGWTSDKFWYWMDDVKVVKKVVWEEERVSLTESDLSGSPPSFVKQVFKYYAEAEKCGSSFPLELEEFNSCLEQFIIVPFDYAGPLTKDSSVAFVKKEIRHSCKKKATCKCSKVAIFVWFLWDGMRLTNCSWRENEPKKVHFGTYLIEMPPILKSKEYLKLLLKAKYDESSRFEWSGSAEDFRSCLSDYMKLPFDYYGPLPEERPILFENNKFNKYSNKLFLLRADGTIVKFPSRDPSISLFLQSSYDDECVPPALRSML